MKGPSAGRARFRRVLWRTQMFACGTLRRHREAARRPGLPSEVGGISLGLFCFLTILATLSAAGTKWLQGFAQVASQACPAEWAMSGLFFLEPTVSNASLLPLS